MLQLHTAAHMLSWKVLSKDDIIYKSCNTQYDIILVTGEQESSRVHNQLMSYPANKLHQSSHKPVYVCFNYKNKANDPKDEAFTFDLLNPDSCYHCTSSTATLLVSHHHNISKPNLHRSWPTLLLTHNISVGSHSLWVPVPGVFGWPVSETFMVLADKHYVSV